MKKILSLALAVMFVLTAQAAQPTDSIGYYFGRTQGALLRKNLKGNQITDSRHFRQRFAEGLQTVFAVDSTDLGYIEGLNLGLKMVKDIVQMQRGGIPTVNRNELIRELTAGILADSVNEVALQADIDALTAILQPIQQLQDSLRKVETERRIAQFDSLAKANEAAGVAFMDSLRKADPKVKFSPSGLGYKLIQKGKGRTPKENEKVLLHYTGKFPNGEVFDSVTDRTAEMARNGVIPGFSEGLGMMNKGSKYIFYIPGKIGYGPRGVQSGLIGPNQTLIFEVELVDFASDKK